MRKTGIFLVSALIILLFIIGCEAQKPPGVQKPSEESLRQAFGEDVVSYGWDLDAYNISYQINYSHLIVKGFREEGTMEWSTTWNDKLKRIVATKLEIADNESDRFPYRGTVTWVIQGDESYPHETEYLFGKNTKIWLRSEKVGKVD